MNHPLFEIVTTRAGAVSIRNKDLNEIMHNPVGPWAEANALYVQQSRLAERLREGTGELVLFDVGLGAAANALAVLHCARQSGGRPLRMISFERELELIRYALLHADKFAHFQGFTQAIESLLRDGKWHEGQISWELRHGDFVQAIQVETYRPHLIYFDPYSSKVNREMWSVATFKALHRLSRPEEQGGSLLYTYSQATPVRVALLAGGFFVGHGLSSGPKEETTIASTVFKDLENPLAATWFQRWQRSHVQAPYEYGALEVAQLQQWMKEHPQFKT